MQTYEKRLNSFLGSYQEGRMVLNDSKFELRFPSVVFMWHMLGPDSVRANPYKVKAIIGSVPNPDTGHSGRGVELEKVAPGINETCRVHISPPPVLFHLM